MRKKGNASMIVETILLLGFIVASMITVYFWAKSRAESETAKTIAGIASSYECADIKIMQECVESDVLIKNTGAHTIKNLLVREVTSLQEYGPLDTEIKPVESVKLSEIIPSYNINYEYEITPLIAVSNKFYMCREKGIKIKCSSEKNNKLG